MSMQRNPQNQLRNIYSPSGAWTLPQRSSLLNAFQQIYDQRAFGQFIQPGLSQIFGGVDYPTASINTLEWQKITTHIPQMSLEDLDKIEALVR